MFMQPKQQQQQQHINLFKKTGGKTTTPITRFCCCWRSSSFVCSLADQRPFTCKHRSENSSVISRILLRYLLVCKLYECQQLANQLMTKNQRACCSISYNSRGISASSEGVCPCVICGNVSTRIQIDKVCDLCVYSFRVCVMLLARS